MADKIDTSHEIGALSCGVTADEVDAGADMTLKAVLACTPATDLHGKILSIEDGDGALIGRIELTGSDGETHETGETVVKAPMTPGAHTWIAV